VDRSVTYQKHGSHDSEQSTPCTWLNSQKGDSFLLYSRASRPAAEPTNLAMQWVLREVLRGIKRPASEADHSFPPSAEVKNMWIYTSTPFYAFIIYRDNIQLQLYHHSQLSYSS